MALRSLECEVDHTFGIARESLACPGQSLDGATFVIECFGGGLFHIERRPLDEARRSFEQYLPENSESKVQALEACKLLVHHYDQNVEFW